MLFTKVRQDHNLANERFHKFILLEKLFERSQHDRSHSQPWLITDATKQSDGTYSFKSRNITFNDFDNIKSSLFNGQQVSFYESLEAF